MLQFRVRYDMLLHHGFHRIDLLILLVTDQYHLYERPSNQLNQLVTFDTSVDTPCRRIPFRGYGSDQNHLRLAAYEQ
jgi:hypothetical protein